MHSAAVIISAYQVPASLSEEISLRQCFRVLGNYPVFLVVPEGLDTAFFFKFGDFHKTISFPASCFKDRMTYSELLLSPKFYAHFLEFRYILTYQTDAFVFSDKLNEWCQKGYSYIGAPWVKELRSDLSDKCNWLPENKFVLKSQVGNGGFSLRKVKQFYHLSFLFKHLFKKWPVNEDVYWGMVAPCLNHFFKVPSAEEASFFSLEEKAREYYEKNRVLPFGCHAWPKHDLEFWKPFIQKEGYTI